MMTRKQIKKKFGITEMVLRYAETMHGEPPGKTKLNEGKTSTIVYNEAMFEEWLKTYFQKKAVK